MTAQLWSGDDTAWWVLLAVAVVVALVASAVAFIAVARCAMWKGRCEDRDHTIANLQEALEDGRLTMMERRHPAAPVHQWGHRRKARPTVRRHWWPGNPTRDLPVAYGCTEEPLRPIYGPPAPPPYPRWIRVEWMEEEVVDMVCAHLQASDAARHESEPPHMWVVPTQRMEALNG